MMRYTAVRRHRTGKARAFIMRDPSLRLARAGSGARQLKRMGMTPQTTLGFRKVDSFFANNQYQHAWPLLSHDDLGNSDQSNQTNNILYSMYMPKRNKGTAPWFRGADTYSVKYCEQGRYEYQRYLMLNRFPSEYKKHFLRFLGNIRSSSASHAIPQEALHWLLRMIVDNFNPQHVHYIAAMRTLQAAGELDMARDVWKIMERQQTWPDTATVCAYLDVCVEAGETTWAVEAWNRYCTELRFLAPGEVDPKPITRTPFSLTREELLYLPKWKKHFDHDPNLDVPDLNRFNRTREVYLRMATAMLAGGDRDMFEHFFSKLETAMVSTPTPVPEPPNPHLVRRPRWSPYEHQRSLHHSPWRTANNGRAMALGPSRTTEDVMQSRFLSNTQFLLHATEEAMAVALRRYVAMHPEAVDAQAAAPAFFAEPPAAAQETLQFCDELLQRAMARLEGTFGDLDTSPLLSTLLRVRRVVGKQPGHALLQYANDFLAAKASRHADGVRESLTAPNYLQVLAAFADESAYGYNAKTRQYQYGPDFQPTTTVQRLRSTLQEIAANQHVAWSAEMHLHVLRALVGCGTMQANTYFVENVLRQFQWDSSFLEVLYAEYRRADSVDRWAELTKRALVWTARYNVAASERLKRLIEDDYDVIHVQTRSLRELAVFQFRDAEEKRHAGNIVNELPNPWIDYVAHALPFPDRDAGYPDEYGDIGQWRAPGGPGSPVKGPGYYAPPMEGEHMRGYTAEWRDLKNPMKPPAFPDPWERKYKQYARGQHPSYDMVYAGPMPEIFPGRRDFRKPTRWDYHDVERQGKQKISGPY
ncbi:Mitochondrial SSU ribosomal protein [Novymonas esmeraldas]|uniref:Mitochondrial SSU ribosomal protein n=1 Tax=Novymonas esmeraldas TaxID=1808958 RepID=A0AAW0EL82_9TRYP